ncbi:MAG: sensor histidine kinase [Candidatus Anammoxibacter sp.]
MEEYIVGYEMKLNDVLDSSDVIPLLKTIIKTGIEFAAVIDENCRFLWFEGDITSYGSGLPSGILQDIAESKYEGRGWELSPLYHEGEPVGSVFVSIPDSIDKEVVSRLMELVSASINLVIRNNAKRKLTTEMHDTVMHKNYEELLATNKKLSISEKKYRELAHSLEQRVEEKTAELKKAITRLLTQEKMAAIGQLAAGIAHEINNPIGFIYSNLNTLLKYVNSLTEMLQFYRKTFKDNTVEASQSAIHPSPPFAKGGRGDLQAEELYKKLKIDYIKKDIFDLIRENINGSERIKQIVANMKDFSHIDETANIEMDINAEIDKTINVLSNDIKDRSVKIIKNYGNIPRFAGNPALICHIFLNILLNAIQSQDNDLIITINTEQNNENIIISIADNGEGIDPEIQKRVFEPFFTTKDVGEGTGMGLAVAYDIVSAHNGTIKIASKAGEGANIIISLPIKKI